MPNTTLETNKKIVIAFFDCALNKKDIATASQYLGAHYIQHAPYVPDGVAGAKKYFTEFYQQFPQAHVEIKKVLAEGDHVFLFAHLVKEPGTLGIALMELFRLENEKIVEHWNVVREISETSINNNGVF